MNNEQIYKVLQEELKDLYDNYNSLYTSLNKTDSYLEENIVLSDSIDNNVINKCKKEVDFDIEKIRLAINYCSLKAEKSDENG